MAMHNARGKKGEAMARDYLTAQGFRVLHVNWRHSYYEIDIIAEQEGVLHFVEVKTRSNLRFGYPEESVSEKKLENLMKAAEEFLYRNPEWKRVQYDVLSIYLGGAEPEFILFPDFYCW